VNFPLDTISLCLITLGFPARKPVSEITKVPEAQLLLKMLKKNKIPLLSIRNDGLNRIPDFRDSLDYREARSAAEVSLNHFRNEYTLIKDLLTAEDIPNMFLKSAGPFPYESDNFDLLVPPGIRNRLDKILEKIGFVAQSHYKEDWKYLYKRFENGQQQNILHIHEEVSWGVERFLDIDKFWQRSIISPDDELIRIPSAEDSFLTTMAHGVYENNLFKLGDLLKVHHVFNRMNGNLDWDYMRSIASSRGWADGLGFILHVLYKMEHRFWGESIIPETELPRSTIGTFANSKINQLISESDFPLDIGRAYTKPLFVKKIIGTPENNAITIPGKLAGFLRDNIIPLFKISTHKSALISLSGIDGAGKSTALKQIEYVCDSLELKHKRVWLRVGNSETMQIVNKLIRFVFPKLLLSAKELPETSKMEVDNHADELVVSNPFISTLWFYFSLFELAAQVFFKVRVPMLFGRVVICDRYLADSILDLMTRFGVDDLDGRFANSFIYSFFPQPDLAIYLYVSAEGSIARKREEFTVKQLQRRVRCLEEISRKIPMIRIESEKGLNSVIDQLTELSSRTLSKC
jgi:thymidylate kinase